MTRRQQHISSAACFRGIVLTDSFFRVFFFFASCYFFLFLKWLLKLSIVLPPQFHICHKGFSLVQFIFFTWLRSHKHDVLVHISWLTSPYLINARVVFLLTVKQMSQRSSQEETLKQPYLKVKCMTFTFRAWIFQSKTCMKCCWKWVWKMINATF